MTCSLVCGFGGQGDKQQPRSWTRLITTAWTPLRPACHFEPSPCMVLQVLREYIGLSGWHRIIIVGSTRDELRSSFKRAVKAQDSSGRGAEGRVVLWSVDWVGGAPAERCTLVQALHLPRRRLLPSVVFGRPRLGYHPCQRSALQAASSLPPCRVEGSGWPEL